MGEGRGHRWAARLVATLGVALALLFGAISPAAADTDREDVVVREVPEAHLRFHYPERFAPAVDELQAGARLAMFKVVGGLGIEEMPTVDVWVLPELDDYFELHGLESRPPGYAVGLSLSDRHTVLLLHGLGPDRQPVDLEKTLAHELAHVGVDVARRGHHVPRWFNEGAAVVLAEEWTLERAELVGRMAALGKLLQFRYLDTRFPPHQDHVSLAYAQSAHFVRMMQQEYGKQVIARVLAQVRQGTHFPLAFEAVTGERLRDVEGRWSHELADGSSVFGALADGQVLFFGASLLFLLAFLIKRRRAHRRLADMEREEVQDRGHDGWSYDRSRYPLPGHTAR